MDKRKWILLVFVTVIIAALPFIGVAGVEGDDALREMREAASLKLETSWDRMSADGAGLPELEEYLYDVLGVVYYAKVAANRTFDPSIISATNQDITQLVDYGYLAYWPLDPIKRGEKLEVVGGESSFLSCAIRIVPCPTSHYTTMNGVACASSFNIFINAPEESFAGLGGSHAIVGDNKDWGSTPPLGALYGLSFFTQSDSARAEVLKKLRESKAEQEESN